MPASDKTDICNGVGKTVIRCTIRACMQTGCHAFNRQGCGPYLLKQLVCPLILWAPLINREQFSRVWPKQIVYHIFSALFDLHSILFLARELPHEAVLSMDQLCASFQWPRCDSFYLNSDYPFMMFLFQIRGPSCCCKLEANAPNGMTSWYASHPSCAWFYNTAHKQQHGS
jgi:hypothetical protein